MPEEISQSSKCYTFCECFYVGRARRVVEKAGIFIRNNLEGKRLCPERAFRKWPTMNFPTQKVQPIDYVVERGLTRIDQAQIIDELAQNPLRGYCLMGPTGVGKSFLLYCLAVEAAYAGRKVMFRKANSWMDAARVCANDNSAEPADMIFMETELVRTPAGPTHLYLDEIENVPPSDFSYRTMFSLLDYCYEHADEIVLSVASNCDLEAWAKLFGEASARRIRCLTTMIQMRSEGE